MEENEFQAKVIGISFVGAILIGLISVIGFAGMLLLFSTLALAYVVYKQIKESR